MKTNPSVGAKVKRAPSIAGGSFIVDQFGDGSPLAGIDLAAVGIVELLLPKPDRNGGTVRVRFGSLSGCYRLEDLTEA